MLAACVKLIVHGVRRVERIPHITMSTHNCMKFHCFLVFFSFMSVTYTQLLLAIEHRAAVQKWGTALHIS